MPLMARLARLMMGVGIGILAICVAAWPVNVLVYHRAAWFYREIGAFVACGTLSLLLGITLRTLLRRVQNPALRK